jgi:hypothetical protein
MLRVLRSLLQEEDETQAGIDSRKCQTSTATPASAGLFLAIAQGDVQRSLA